MLGLSLVLSGCVAKRGVDFGHWARTGEHVELVKIFINPEEEKLKGNEIMLLLPPFGRISAKTRDDLQNNMLQEMKNYFPVRVVAAKNDGQLAEYLEKDNLFFAGDIVNAEEVAAIGQLTGVSHIICVVVNEFRPYQPQVLSLTIHIIDSTLGRSIAELHANLDCSEQQVVMAMDGYLQGREARKMDVQSLEILLSSPTAFSAFASAKCSKVLSDNLWHNKRLKQVIETADKE